MHKLVRQFLHRKFKTTGPQVALSVEVAFEVAINRGDEAVLTNVEFAFVDQQRVMDVFLDDA